MSRRARVKIRPCRRGFPAALRFSGASPASWGLASAWSTSWSFSPPVQPETRFSGPIRRCQLRGSTPLSSARPRRCAMRSSARSSFPREPTEFSAGRWREHPPGRGGPASGRDATSRAAASWASWAFQAPRCSGRPMPLAGCGPDPSPTTPISASSPSLVIAPCRIATSTGLDYPGSPRDLNLSNRRMRTRTSGGVGGVAGVDSRRPYPDVRLAWRADLGTRVPWEAGHRDRSAPNGRLDMPPLRWPCLGTCRHVQARAFLGIRAACSESAAPQRRNGIL